VRVVLQVSAGELFDRISILELKRARLPEAGRAAIERQLADARAERERALLPSKALAQLAVALSAANEELWHTEESLRACEAHNDFGPEFVALARRVYTTNDRRAALKRRIDELVGCEMTEQKSHTLPEV
jgi:hypothetical protein